MAHFLSCTETTDGGLCVLWWCKSTLAVSPAEEEGGSARSVSYNQWTRRTSSFLSTSIDKAQRGWKQCGILASLSVTYCWENFHLVVILRMISLCRRPREAPSPIASENVHVAVTVYFLNNETHLEAGYGPHVYLPIFRQVLI